MLATVSVVLAQYANVFKLYSFEENNERYSKKMDHKHQYQDGYHQYNMFCLQLLINKH